MEGRSRGDRLRVSRPLMVIRYFLQIRLEIGPRAEFGIVDIEGAILYDDVKEGVADIPEILLIVRFEGERL